MVSESQKAADARYKAANLKQIKFALNKKTDADLLSHLEATKNVQGYIKSLIRRDIAQSRG